MTSKCVVDLSPRWIVLFKKGDVSFALKFNQLYDMIDAVARARGVGYTVKTMPAQPTGR